MEGDRVETALAPRSVFLAVELWDFRGNALCIFMLHTIILRIELFTLTRPTRKQQQYPIVVLLEDATENIPLSFLD